MLAKVSRKRYNMASIKELLDAMNEKDFWAFPNQTFKNRTTISVKGNDGERYFLTRVRMGVNEDGSPKYQWARGAKMRPNKNIEKRQQKIEYDNKEL